MKRVFLFLVSTLVCMACMTSCGSDDDVVTLTGITVAPKTIKLPVGSEQKITVTAVPADAIGTYTFTSQNTSIATVDNNGVVKIVGVGKTTITVTSGSFSQTVDVEGTINSLTVKDADGNSSGTYPYNGTPITIALTATIEPAGTDVSVTWTSSAATAAVTAGSDGLTATVTLTGEGAATITATAGETTGTYTISTTSVFESAAGYWAFNDPTNPGKATYGNDLIYTEADITFIDGPSAAKKAIQITAGQPGLRWNHSITGNGLRNYTVLIDAKPKWEPDRAYYPIYWNGSAEGEIFAFRPRDGFLTVNCHGGTTGEIEPAQSTEWMRIVVIVATSDADPDLQKLMVYYNGMQIFSDGTSGHDLWFRFELNEGVPVWFIMSNAEDPNPNCEYPVSTLAAWDRVLTPEEIASLGGVSK
jgi:hypothetical protein